MKLVIIESPFAGDRLRNIAYARAAVRDSLLRGEAPIASHLLHTQDGILEDDKPGERKLGIDAGHAWTPQADLVAVYIDFGMSAGMTAGVQVALNAGTDIEYRNLEGWGT